MVIKIKGMNIHQVSLNYVVEEDRILMRISTTDAQELRMWLTRRLVIGLWPLLNKVMADQIVQLEPGLAAAASDDDLKQMLASHRKKEMVEKADFATPYAEKASAHPLGTKPLLVTSVDVRAPTAGRLGLTFVEKLTKEAQPRSFSMDLEPKLASGLLHLMERSIQRSEWQSNVGAGITRSETPAVVAEPAKVERPKYLN